MASATKTKQPKVRLVLPIATAAFAWLYKPDTGHQYSNNKYKITLVLPGDTDVVAIKAKCLKFAKDVYPDVNEEDFVLPFKSGDGHKKEEFHGKLLSFASSQFKPTVVDGKRQPLPKGIEARSGDRVRSVVGLYAYQKIEKVREGKNTVNVTTYGVSFQLSTVQLVRKLTGGGGVDLLDDLSDDDYDAFEAPDTDADNSDGNDDPNADF